MNSFKYIAIALIIASTSQLFAQSRDMADSTYSINKIVVDGAVKKEVIKKEGVGTKITKVEQSIITQNKSKT